MRQDYESLSELFPEETPEETPPRNTGPAVMAHLLPLVFVGFGLSFLAFLPPLIIWNQHNGKDAFVAECAREALNIQISLFLYGLAALILLVAGAGSVLVQLFSTGPGWGSPELIPIYWVLFLMAAVALLVFEVVVCLIGGVQATKGKVFRAPAIIRLL
jgi:hypothetical protein